MINHRRPCLFGGLWVRRASENHSANPPSLWRNSGFAATFTRSNGIVVVM